LPRVSSPRALRLPLAGGILVLAFLSLSLAACGGKDDTGPSPGPSPSPVPGSAVSYTAVGASDAVGVGSTAPCPPFTACPDGRGYVPGVVRALERQGRTVTLMNLGLPGAVLSPSIQALGNQYGRGIQANFIEQEAPFVPRTSTLVTIFAGGNDANAVATAVDRGAAGGDENGFIDRQVSDFGAQYASLLGSVTSRAASTRVIVLNLPNLAGLPYTAGYRPEQKRWMQRISVGFAKQANALASRGAVVVDLLCDPRSYQAGNYSSDGFHPNDTGYAFITEKIVQAIAGGSSPQGDCSFMRLIR
jgi:lysophospholipase L1-like esterase